MKKIGEILAIVLLVILFGVIAVILLPILLVLAPVAYFKGRAQEKKFKEFIFQSGDKNFFCYNNRKDAREFIEQVLLPKLDKRVEIIYLKGRQPVSNYPAEFISMALYRLKNYKRFPHLLKLRGGEMIDASVNPELFNTMNQNKPLDELLGHIHEFFELDTERKDKPFNQ